jgi:hypothetical protein
MANHSTVADPYREALLAEAGDDRHGDGRQDAHDLLLVFGVATVVIGVMMVSQGGLSSQPAAHLVSGEHSALMPAESAVPAPDPRLTAIMSPTVGVPPTPRASNRSATRVVAACTSHLDLDLDLRLELAATAQQRRFASEREHLAGFFGAPANQDVPAKYRELTGDAESVAHVDASPPALRQPNAPDC